MLHKLVLIPFLLWMMFASLAGRQVFSKLDLAHVYQQLQLNKRSHQYVTINMQKGLFRYTRLHFGVATVPAIIQSTTESILSGLLHMSVYPDDLQMTGESEAAHIHNLSAEQERLESAGIC